MLFGVDFCRRRVSKRRRGTKQWIGMRVWAAAFAALIFTGLLLIAPQWLLVLLVLLLTAFLIAVVCGAG